MASAPTPPSISTSEATLALPPEGGCGCKYIRYRLLSKPLVVQCCHCRWCQRESGSAFATNAMIEANRLIHLGPEPQLCKVPSESGLGQTIARCPKCNVALWSNYGRPLVRYVRVGTLDKPERCPPELHIWTVNKQPWVVLSENVPVLEESYDEKENYWSKESMERWKIFLERVEIWEAKMAKEGEQNGASEGGMEI